MTPLLRTIALAAGLCAAATAAQAGLEVTLLDPEAGGLVPVINTGPLNAWQELSGAGVVSQARFLETRVSQLYNPAQGQLEYLDLMADSGWNASTQVGGIVQADANLDNVVAPAPGLPYPAQACTDLYQNHLRTATGRRYSFYNSTPTFVPGLGQEVPALTLHRTGGNQAYAASGWYDTWQAQQQASTTLTVAFDGLLRHSDPCTESCLAVFPPGTDTQVVRSPGMNLEMHFYVLDLDTPVLCDDPDLCAGPPERPLAVAQLQARYRAESGEPLPLAVDLQYQLSFQAQTGHRYLAIGVMEAQAQDGGVVDFFNTFKLAGVQAPVGTFSSAALGGADLSSHFAQAVPEPGTLALWAASVLVLGGRLRRR